MSTARGIHRRNKEKDSCYNDNSGDSNSNSFVVWEIVNVVVNEMISVIMDECSENENKSVFVVDIGVNAVVESPPGLKILILLIIRYTVKTPGCQKILL